MSKSVHIINGANLNLLGTRQTDIYGEVSLADIEAQCAARLAEHGLTLKFQQSNDEGALVDMIQEANQSCGLIINGGAYSHTSIAILDALKTLAIPVIEVHLSNIFAREDFRHHSYISPAATGIICGLGAHSYYLAIDAVAELLQSK